MAGNNSNQSTDKTIRECKNPDCQRQFIPVHNKRQEYCSKECLHKVHNAKYRERHGIAPAVKRTI